MLGMANVSIIFGLLVIPYLIAYLFQFRNLTMAGRIGVCAVFLFTALGHFFKTSDMTAMLPPFIPARRALIYLSGFGNATTAIANTTSIIYLYGFLCNWSWSSGHGGFA